MGTIGLAAFFDFLTDIGRIFACAPLSGPAIAECARHAIPRLGDWCSIQLMDEFHSVRSAAVAFREPGFPGEVLVEQWDTTSRAAGNPMPGGRFPAESSLVLPLSAGGQVLGILTLGRAGSGGFSREQVQLAEEFARSIAFGLPSLRSGPGDDAGPGRGSAGSEPWAVPAGPAAGGADARCPPGELPESILSTLRDPLAVLDSLGRPLFMNRAHAEALGYASVEEAMAQPAAILDARLEVFDASGRRLEAADYPLAKALEGRAGPPEALRCRNAATGREFWFEIQAVPHAEPGGRVCMAVLLSYDVGELRKIRADLHVLGERYRLAQEAGRVGVWEEERLTGHLSWSPRMCEIHAIAEDRAPATFEEFLLRVHPEDRFRVRESQKQAERSRPETDFRIVLPSRDIRWLHAVGGSQRDAAGGLVRVLGACIDITDRKRAEAAARRLREQAYRTEKAEILGRAVAGMSHDINDILTSILGFSELILETPSLPLVLRYYAAEIR